MKLEKASQQKSNRDLSTGTRIRDSPVHTFRNPLREDLVQTHLCSVTCFHSFCVPRLCLLMLETGTMEWAVRRKGREEELIYLQTTCCSDKMILCCRIILFCTLWRSVVLIVNKQLTRQEDVRQERQNKRTLMWVN